jgi:amino acid transporter
VVARQNLGTPFGLAAAAALMIDYLLVVAVSVTAGVQELTSAFPALYDWRVAICLACIALMMLANLRGIRESGTLFAVPTYAFVATLGCWSSPASPSGWPARCRTRPRRRRRRSSR